MSSCHAITRFVVFPVILGGAIAASTWSVRLACGDYWFREQTVPGIRRAIAFTPGQAGYYVRLALLDPPGNQRTAIATLRHAVALDPSDAASWIELGLHYEEEGDRLQAEQCLLRAAREDAQYLPRWTLANYYFRANEIDRFWFWTAKAAALVHDDPTPLFRLCGRVAEDGALVDRLNIGRKDVQAAYLSYLLNEGRLNLIQPVSRRLLTATRASDVPLLLTACDRLIQSSDAAGALVIWNGLAYTHAIPSEPLQPAQGIVLTNGDFRAPSILRGFDWRLQPTDGVSASVDEGGGLRLAFSGGQPEDCEFLGQFVPLQENIRYKLEFAYQTSGISAGSGLEWRISDPAVRRTLIDAHSLPSTGEASGALTFATPANCRMAHIVLAYRRAPGTTRMEGSIVLRKVTLKPAPPTLIYSENFRPSPSL